MIGDRIVLVISGRHVTQRCVWSEANGPERFYLECPRGMTYKQFARAVKPGDLVILELVDEWGRKLWKIVD